MKAKNKQVMAIVGGQYGSEGKGVVAKHYANNFNVHVRVGGPNAGHCFVHKGVEYKMQSIPCGWVNPDAALVIGRGAVVDIEQMQKEIKQIELVDPSITDRIFVDAGAMVIDNRHREEENGVSGDIHQRIGSTGKGVGAARVAFMRRDDSLIEKAATALPRYGLEKMLMENTAGYLYTMNKNRGNILLEGTQGFGLSLVHGPHPYVTSADTTAGQLLVDCGLPPQSLTDSLLVVRSMPIRVAGNSGHMKGEVSWDEVSSKIGKKVEERTTVTNKVRRIGSWDEDLVIRASQINGTTKVAFTFLDYVVPEDAGKTDPKLLSNSSVRLINYVEKMTRAKVVLAGTGYTPQEGWICCDLDENPKYEPEDEDL